MQLLCNGVALDLYDNAGLQFTHSNPLFAFDDLKCERTTNFKLPATPTNDRVFSLAKIPAYSGEGMRRKFPCQLQAGAVVRDGYLYVANFDGKDYNAVFVTGELIGLQRIKELGTLRDLMPNFSTPQWLATPKNANVSGIFNIDTVKYHVQGSDVVNPCVRLFEILKDVLTREQIDFDLSNVTKRDLMYIRGGKITVENINDYLYNGQAGTVSLAHILGLTTKVNTQATYGEFMSFEVEDAPGKYEWSLHGATAQTIQQLSFQWDAVLEMPSDLPDDYFLVTGNLFTTAPATGELVFPSVRCLGDYWMRINYSGMSIEGVPLAGRNVSIPANTPFMLIHKNCIKWSVPDDEGQIANIGFNTATMDGYKFDIRVSLDHDFVPGENVPLKACVPDVSIISALKLFAIQEGLILNYSDGKIILEENIIPENSDELKSITKIGEVVRTFGKYAQRNIVEFDSDIPDYMKIRTEYDIINDNIEPQKELEKIVFSEGEQKQHVIDDNVYDDFLMPEGEDGDFVAYLSGDTNDEYMRRVQIKKNADIQNLCDRSTQIKIEARMPLLQYDAIKPKTGLLVDGSTYLWTERSWQKDVAKMTLAQFAKAIVTPVTPVLPPEYQRVEWLRGYSPNSPNINNKNEVYIDTLIKTSQIYGIECKVSKNDSRILSYWDTVALMGINPRTGYHNFSVWSGYRGAPNKLLLDSTNTQIPWSVGEILNIKMDMSNVATINGATVNTNITDVYSAVDDCNFYLFAANQFPQTRVPDAVYATDVSFYDKFIMYGQHGEIIAHFIPCYRKADNVAGMYDIVRQQFFINSGSGGSFTVGPDVN